MTSEQGVPGTRRSLVLGLSLWGAVLGALVALSHVYGQNARDPGQTAVTAFHAATAVAYAVAFFHCLLRLVYSRWPSWLLFTLGFGLLTFAGLAGVVQGSHFGANTMVRDHLELLRLGMLPLATLVLLAAAYASRARARGHRIGTLKTFLKLFLISTILGSLWRLGVFELIGKAIGATSVNADLAVEGCSALALAMLLFRIKRLVRDEHDEIVAPSAYWAMAVLLGRLVSVAGYVVHSATWWQVAGLEMAGLSALLLGLGQANERAHRSSSEKMSELQAMQQVSWSLVGATNLSELTHAFAKGMAENFKALAGVVYLPGESDEELVVNAVYGIDDATIFVGKACSLRPDRRRGFHCGHTSRAYASGTVQAVTDVFSDVEFLPWRTVAQSDGVVVSVPMPYRDRVIGVVNLFLVGVDSIPDTQAELLRSIAAAVSPSIENARLRSQLSEVVEQAA